jgi:hypothetical protein
MHDPLLSALVALTALAGLVILAQAALRAWHEWVELQRLALAAQPDGRHALPAGPAAARIELADLRERVRKLEAIAAGIDL